MVQLMQRYCSPVVDVCDVGMLIYLAFGDGVRCHNERLADHLDLG